MLRAKVNRAGTMSKQDQIFADGIGAIAVTGTVVRIDFVTMSQAERDPSGNAKMEFTHRVVLPLDGFLNAFGKFQETVQALARRGVIRPQSPASPVPQPALQDESSADPVADAAPILETPQAPPRPSRPFP